MIKTIVLWSRLKHKKKTPGDLNYAIGLNAVYKDLKTSPITNMTRTTACLNENSIKSLLLLNLINKPVIPGHLLTRI